MCIILHVCRCSQASKTLSSGHSKLTVLIWKTIFKRGDKTKDRYDTAAASTPDSGTLGNLEIAPAPRVWGTTSWQAQSWQFTHGWTQLGGPRKHLVCPFGSGLTQHSPARGKLAEHFKKFVAFLANFFLFFCWRKNVTGVQATNHPGGNNAILISLHLVQNIKIITAVQI